ncbi:hypothetical protein A5744_02670 [Mycobacterium sp. IS-1264]|nr:hypothetical protein A5744_02670 [Mycobacterium sp. IS-1264]
MTATLFAMIVGLGLAGLGAAIEAQAQPGPFPQWCPGEFWDPGWGNNWDWNNCHDWRAAPPDRPWEVPPPPPPPPAWHP